MSGFASKPEMLMRVVPCPIRGDDIDVKFAFGIFNKVFETARVFGVE